MKTILKALIIVTMAVTLCVVGVELVNAESSELFLRFFGFLSVLLIDLYVLVAIHRNNKQD